MPRETSTVTVTPIKGEPFCYWVESWERPEFPHRVELLGLMGNGECHCIDFTTRCVPNHRNNGGVVVNYWDRHTGKPNPFRTRCRHITAAFEKDQNDRLRSLALAEQRAGKPAHL